jgi:hypothetical protein
MTLPFTLTPLGSMRVCAQATPTAAVKAQASATASL